MTKEKNIRAIIILSSLYSEFDQDYTQKIQNLLTPSTPISMTYLYVNPTQIIPMSQVKIVDLSYYAKTGITSIENIPTPWHSHEYIKSQLNKHNNQVSDTLQPNPPEDVSKSLRGIQESLYLQFKALLQYVYQESINLAYPKLVFYMYPPFMKLSSYWTNTLYTMELCLAHTQQWNFIPYVIPTVFFRNIKVRIGDFSTTFIQIMKGLKLLFPNTTCSIYFNVVLQMLFEVCGAKLTCKSNPTNDIYDFIIVDKEPSDLTQSCVYRQGYTNLGRFQSTNNIPITTFLKNMISSSQEPSLFLPTTSGIRHPNSYILHSNSMQFASTFKLDYKAIEIISRIPIKTVAMAPGYTQILYSIVGKCLSFTRHHLEYYGIAGGYTGYAFLKNPIAYVSNKLEDSFKLDQNPFWNNPMPISLFMKTLEFISPSSALKNFEMFLPHEANGLLGFMSKRIPCNYIIIIPSLEHPKYNSTKLKESPIGSGSWLLPDAFKMERVLVQIFHTMRLYIITLNSKHLDGSIPTEKFYSDLTSICHACICAVSLILRHNWNKVPNTQLLYYIAKQILIELVESKSCTVNELIATLGLYFSPIIISIVLTNEYFAEEGPTLDSFVSIVKEYQIPIRSWGINHRMAISKVLYDNVLKQMMAHINECIHPNIKMDTSLSLLCNFILDSIFYTMNTDSNSNTHPRNPLQNLINVGSFMCPNSFSITGIFDRNWVKERNRKHFDISFWVWALSILVFYIEPYSKNELYHVSGIIMSSISEFLGCVKRNNDTESMIITLTFLIYRISVFRNRHSTSGEDNLFPTVPYLTDNEFQQYSKNSHDNVENVSLESSKLHDETLSGRDNLVTTGSYTVDKNFHQHPIDTSHSDIEIDSLNVSSFFDDDMEELFDTEPGPLYSLIDIPQFETSINHKRKNYNGQEFNDLVKRKLD